MKIINMLVKHFTRSINSVLEINSCIFLIKLEVTEINSLIIENKKQYNKKSNYGEDQREEILKMKTT